MFKFIIKPLFSFNLTLFFVWFNFFLNHATRTEETPEIAGVEKEEQAQPKSTLARAMEGISSTFGVGEEKNEKRPSFSVIADNLLPKIRRGLKGERKEDTVVVGWKADVKSRKQREEVLRYVLRFFLRC